MVKQTFVTKVVIALNYCLARPAEVPSTLMYCHVNTIDAEMRNFKYLCNFSYAVAGKYSAMKTSNCVNGLGLNGDSPSANVFPVNWWCQKETFYRISTVEQDQPSVEVG